MTRWTVAPGDAGLRLDAWLAARPEIGSRGRAREAIERGKVFVNDEEIVFSDAARRLEAGDLVRFWPDRPGSSRPRARDIVSRRHELRVVHEDEAILVVDKAPGWLVEPLPGAAASEVTLRDLLADHLRDRAGVRPYVVHRIDRDTSGLVLFALTPVARDDLKAQFERRTPTRNYVAVVRGRVTPPSGTWRDQLAWDRERLVQKRAHANEERAREAIARYRVVEQFEDAAVIEVSLVTGKRNQIRVQAGLRGHPLVGERVYRYGQAEDGGACRAEARTASEGGRRAEGLALSRQALHAARLGFRHPVSRRQVEFTAPLPEDLAALIARLRKTAEG